MSAHSLQRLSCRTGRLPAAASLRRAACAPVACGPLLARSFGGGHGPVGYDDDYYWRQPRISKLRPRSERMDKVSQLMVRYAEVKAAHEKAKQVGTSPPQAQSKKV